MCDVDALWVGVEEGIWRLVCWLMSKSMKVFVLMTRRDGNLDLLKRAFRLFELLSLPWPERLSRGGSRTSTNLYEV